MWIGTFHSIGARLLRQYGEAVGLKRDFLIYDTDDQKRLMANVLEELQISERQFPPRQILSAIDGAKNKGQGPEFFDGNDYFEEVVARAYTKYEEALAKSNATDFGGLLMKTLELVEKPGPARDYLATRFEHVLVDEFQDTNNVQYRLIRFSRPTATASRRWATRTNLYTNGAGRTSATFWTLNGITRAPRSSNWKKTTEAPATS